MRTRRLREPSLDFVKGVLVEVMIVFHSIQYFVGFREPALNYLAFVTGAFVFLAGGVVSEIYLRRSFDERGGLSSRLILRAGKLLLLFSALNLVFHALLAPGLRPDSIIELPRIIGRVFGSGDKARVIYEMLVPIAYSLIAAAVLQAMFPRPVVLATVSVVLFLVLTKFASHLFNIQYLALGILGLAYGFLGSHREKPTGGIWLAAVSTMGTVAYFGAIASLPQDTAWLYAFGVVCVVEFIRSTRLRCPLPTAVCEFLELLGRYSLFAYLGQIVILRALLAAIGDEMGRPVFALGPVMVCNLLLFGLIWAMGRLRPRLPWFDGLYRTVLA